MSVSINGTNGVTFNDGSVQTTSALTGWRNRIINGGMRISQAQAGASISVSTDPSSRNFPVDRFFCSANGGGVYTAQRSTVVPASFSNSIALTVTTPDSSIASGDFYYVCQAVEGFNTSDLSFGNSAAKAVTLSFWVRSSVAGTYTGSLRNNSTDRAYSFSYTINSANTFEYKTITISGDTTGTWATDNSCGIWVAWDLGSGSNFNGTANAWSSGNFLRNTSGTNWISTNGATFYITGVQLEAGSTATDFERRPIGTELALCQRYYQTYSNLQLFSYNTTGANNVEQYLLPVVMRATPTASLGTWSYSNMNTAAVNDTRAESLRLQALTTNTGAGFASGSVTLAIEL